MSASAREEAASRERTGGSSGKRAGDGVHGFRVDPTWRHTHGGFAARLDPRTTIDVADPVGRWRAVEPRRPHDGWRSVGKVGGLVTWTVVIATGWWVGSSRGTGPLGVLRQR